MQPESCTGPETKENTDQGPVSSWNFSTTKTGEKRVERPFAASPSYYYMVKL